MAHIPYKKYDPLNEPETLLDFFKQRRSIRFFSDKPVPKETIDRIIQIASTAPSGANKQPWFFCAISNPKLKSEIRKAAEKEEYTNYHGRMSDTWIKDLEKFGTNWEKPFLETAPWLIVMFKQSYELLEDQTKAQNYYVNESVGIAAGFLISAIHQCGLVTLTHTPSPMDFLSKLLHRPKNEKAYLLLPIGYAASDATVPELPKKQGDELMEWFE